MGASTAPDGPSNQVDWTPRSGSGRVLVARPRHESENVTTIKHLSHSTVSDWLECSEKVRLRKIEKVPSSPSWSLVGGSLVHTVTETLDLQDFGIPVTDQPSEFNKDTFEAAIAAEEKFSGTSRDEWYCAGRVSKEWPDKENYDWWLRNGPVHVKNWRRFLTNGLWQVAITPDGDPAIEIELDEPVGGAPFKGYIDRVLEVVGTKELVVVDLKTGSRDPMSAGQLGVYSVGLGRKYGPDFWPQKGAYFMTRKGVTTIPADLRPYNDGRLDHEYGQVWTGIQNDIFVPKVGMLCGSCGVKDYCRAVGGKYADDYLPYDKENA